MIRLIFFFCLFSLSLLAETIQTFYGPLEIEEPVLLELIKSPSFQRLKKIHQYGVAYYTTHREEYTRYDHSLGVFAILRLKNASLEEQIAGLLHDVSHTVFSHVGDWIFKDKYSDKDYHNSIHNNFLEKYGLASILRKYNYNPEKMLPLKELYPMLEQDGPLLCADRIDYNIQGAYYRKFITYEEALNILASLSFIDGEWVAQDASLMAKIGRFALHMTENCWGNAHNYLLSSWLASAILKGIELQLITYEDIHFGTDQMIWDTLMSSSDKQISQYMFQVTSSRHFFHIVDPKDADLIVKTKFRGIDPLILVDGKKVRLTNIDSEYLKEYESTKDKISKGYAMKLEKVGKINFFSIKKRLYEWSPWLKFYTLLHPRERKNQEH